jgi:hypothetical protein
MPGAGEFHTLEVAVTPWEPHLVASQNLIIDRLPFHHLDAPSDTID